MRYKIHGNEDIVGVQIYPTDLNKWELRGKVTQKPERALPYRTALKRHTNFTARNAWTLLLQIKS